MPLRHALDAHSRPRLVARGWLPVAMASWSVLAAGWPATAATAQEPATSALVGDAPQGAPNLPLAPPVDERAALALDLQQPLRERLAALETLLADPSEESLDAALRAALAKAFAERGRREAVQLLDRLLLDPQATPATRRRCIAFALELPDPQLAAPLLALLEREAELGGPVDPPLVAALRAAHEATRRRWVEGEEAALAKATPEALLAALDHSEGSVRRAALGRFIELAQRPELARGESFEKAHALVCERLPAALARDPAGNGSEELRRLAELAVLLDPGTTVGAQLTAAFVGATSEARRLALLPALRRLPPARGGGEAALALGATLLEADAAVAAPAYLDALLDALRSLADARALPAVERCMASAFPPLVRARAFAAAAELARRDASAETMRRVIDRLVAVLVEPAEGEARYAAALGLSQLLEAALARVDPAVAATAVDGENVGRIFEAMRRTLPTALGDRVLAEQCSRALCRVPGRAAVAAQVLSDALLAAPEGAAVREVLIGGLKELGDRAGLPAIVAALPRGGPSVEPGAVGKAAYAALLAVLRSAEEGEARLEVEIEAVDLCLARGEPAWGYYLAARLREELDRFPDAPPQHRIRSALARSILALRDPARFEVGYEECEWIVLQASADEPAGAAGRWLLLELAEAIGPARAYDAALYGAELRAELVDPARRQELSFRVARLLFAAGDWEAAYRWLDDRDEATAPLEQLQLKARAAARRSDVNALRDATRLHELLLGKAGSGGGALAPDAPERPAFELALVELLLDGGRDREAAALLAKVPAAERLPEELATTRRRVESRVKSLRGG